MPFFFLQISPPRIFGYAPQARTLDTHISRLRKKLEQDGGCPETVSGDSGANQPARQAGMACVKNP
jgi:Transcriptional regulatory protein, C terminal